MPIATPEQYVAMIAFAQLHAFAFPAVNVTSLTALNAALKGLAEKRSDGIIQMSLGGAKFVSGLNVRDPVLGAIVLAEAACRLAERYDILIALHTDHCLPDEVDSFLRPLIQETARRRRDRRPNLFLSHMLDASALPLQENMRLSRELLKECARHEIILEVETGVVGGKEDENDQSKVPEERLYTTPEEMMYVYESLKDTGRYLYAATFGNRHGRFKDGQVQLKPEILKNGQAAVTELHGTNAEFDLVFHGGSGSPINQIHETLNFGVVKMNIDTDTQYAFTRPIVGHMMNNYDQVLQIDGGLGNKDAYDPRAYLRLAEERMAKRVEQACDDLRSTGRTLLEAID